GGPRVVMQNPGVFGPVQVGMYGGGSEGEEVDQSTLGIGGMIDLGEGFGIKGAYDKSRVAVDSPYYKGVPRDDDAWNIGLEKKWTFADGGRTGFKKGTKFDPKRRTILKGIGALATLPIIGKYFKWAKPLAKSSKVLTSVPIKTGVDGMPAWFKPLVNQVIKEGDDVTKTYGTLERQIVHKTNLPDSKTEVLVTQNLDSGDVVVDIGAGKHGFGAGHLGQPVRLEYKAGEVIEPTIKKGKEIKGQKTKEEFWVEEAEFTGGHPENVKFEESTFNKFGEHGSDFSEVEKFATGTVKKTKKNIKSIPISKGILPDMASGGRVPFSKGKLAKYATPEGLAALIEKLFPGTTKLGKTSRPMAPKTELKQAIAGFQEREAAAKLKIWEDETKVREAVDDIFSSGDYKMDAEMAAEALVENNPAAFGGKLIDDIDDATRSEVYGAVLRVVQSDLAKMLQMKKLSKPTKT
ncbi:uncharacterized protein METZ01_LOCUS242215, partial [marine metagenome]